MKRGYELPVERQRRQRITRRNVTFLALIFAVVAAGYISITMGNDESLINTAAVSALGQPIDGMFVVTGDVTVPVIALEVENVALVVVTDEPSTLEVNGLDVQHAEGPLVFQGFEGDIKVDGTKVTFDGTAVSAVVDQVAINGKVVVSSEMNFDQLEIGNMKQKKLSFIGSGALEVAGRGRFTATHSPIEFRSFVGTLNFAERMSLNGQAEKVVIDSDPRISIE